MSDDLRDWIGAEEGAEDMLTATLVERFRATLTTDGVAPATGEAAPRLIHFCLCQPPAAMSALGEDGHPARGGFLPPVPLPRRMWAGSAITFHGDLHVGDIVRRRSRIADVAQKEGRTGQLCFVTVEHEFTVDEQLRIKDRQNIVYRALRDSVHAAPAPAAPQGNRIAIVDPTAPLLFRYSALTFNGHRIHYDAPYATRAEGYPGLVIHGPLQATFLLQLAADMRGQQPTSFEFRSLSTLYNDQPLTLHGVSEAETLSLWTTRPGGPLAMQARARWS
jgi:3-methylfumaryl-CoA hydratase